MYVWQPEDILYNVCWFENWEVVFYRKLRLRLDVSENSGDEVVE